MTQYFEYFPKITFNKTQVRDTTLRLDFIKKIKGNISLFEFIVLKDNQRPEDIALEFYGDPNLYWIVLYMNDVIDPYFDWLLSESRLFDYVADKYGAENVYSTHHYELESGLWVDFGTPGAREITNLQYETNLNEEKRKLKVLKNRYIPQVLEEYKRELREG